MEKVRERAELRAAMAAGGGEAVAALTSTLTFQLQVAGTEDTAAAGEPQEQASRTDKWVDVSADLTRAAVVALDRARVDVVSFGTQEVEATTIHLAERVVDVALSPCGAYVAVTDTSGSLGLYRSAGELLVAYPVLKPGSADRVVATVFATTDESSERQEVVVSTAAGTVIHLSSLLLADIEHMLDTGDAAEDVVGALVDQMQVERFNVGKLNEGARSLVVAHHFPSSTVIITANHCNSMSVWKACRDENQQHSSFKNISSFDDAASEWTAESMQLANDKRFLFLLSDGHLSSWDWQAATKLVDLSVRGVHDFAVVGGLATTSDASSLLAIASSSDNSTQSIRLELARVSHQFSTDTHTVVAEQSTALFTGDIMLFGSRQDTSAFSVASRENGIVSVTSWHKSDNNSSQRSPKHEPEVVAGHNSTADNEPTALEYVAIAEALANTTIESLDTEADAQDFLRQLTQCAGKIGEDGEASRSILTHLAAVARQIRQCSLSAPDGDQPLAQELVDWSAEISATSYHWTTFQLLQTSMPDASSSGGDAVRLRDKWATFQKTSVVDMLRVHLKKGAIRAAAILWSRHLSEEVTASVCDLLRCLPDSLPVSVYQPWIHQEVIPALVGYADATRWVVEEDSAPTRAGDSSLLLKEFANWVFGRAEAAAEHGDLQTGITLCSLLAKSADTLQGELSSEGYFFKFKLLTTGTTSINLTTGGDVNPVDQIDQLHRTLVHINHLAETHGFKISLSLFNDETPATIAMSMLDRAQTVEELTAEIETHAKRYLAFCDVAADPVLSEFVIELAESAQLSEANPMDETRALAVLGAISDADIRAEAALAVLRSVAPPYSEGIKSFANDVTLAWTSRHQEEIEEHVRLMKIQDMLTSYGVKHFAVDSRNATRLVSHILTQITRPSAISDAMLLVDAYSQLRCDRVVVQFTENLLAFPVDPTTPTDFSSTIQTRTTLAMAALMELKRRNPDKPAMPVLSALDEVVAFGIELLHHEENKHDRQRQSTAGEAGTHSLVLGDGLTTSSKTCSFVLGMLESLVAAFLPEVHAMSEIAASMREVSAVAFVNSDEFLLTDELVQDLQKLRRIESEFGMLLSVETLRDQDACEARLKLLMRPDVLFASETALTVDRPNGAGQSPPKSQGKGKKRAAASIRGNTNRSEDARRIRRREQEVEPMSASFDRRDDSSDDQQVNDKQATLLQQLGRFAAAIGVPARSFQSLVAEQAACHGSTSRAVLLARDLFARAVTMNRNPVRRDQRSPPAYRLSSLAASAETLGRIAMTISDYTAAHVDELYSAVASVNLASLRPSTLARLRAPTHSLELLRYSICACEMDAFEETLMLLKSATLIDDALQLTQLDLDLRRPPQWRIYTKWLRGDAVVLPCDQVMKLATRFATEEHDNLSRNAGEEDTVASKRFISFLVEQHADLLSLQVMLAMRVLPDDAAGVVQTQASKLVSTVFQTHEIDSHFALGLLLTLEQKDAFAAFRRQISRENVAKDFNRFQQLAFIGAEAARAWQQIGFLHQCVELEGNARWWHYLNLLDIKCEHKAFQSDQRDIEYIRSLVPQLITKSSYDLYTVLEFTRHYHIDDSYPSLLYVEALLLDKEASSSGLEYQDRIVGVVEDVHDQHLIALLLKTLPRISTTDYDRLQFVFQLLLEHTSYSNTAEVERRIEVLHILKAHRVFIKTKRAKLQQLSHTQGHGEAQSVADEGFSIPFHDIIAKPREVLSDLLTVDNYDVLAGISAPLRLEPDELEIILLKNMVENQLGRVHKAAKTTDSSHSTAQLARDGPASSPAQFGVFKPVLERLTDAESRVTAAEWLAENFPLGDEKVKALEFALRSAQADADSRDDQIHRRDSSATFTGAEALARLKFKILRAKIEMLLRAATAEDPALLECLSEADTVAGLMKLLGNPRELFLEIYRRFALRCFYSSSHSLNAIADKLATMFGLSAESLRLALVREWLVQDAVRKPPSRLTALNARPSAQPSADEDPFELLEDEVLDRVDEQYVQRILFVATRCVRDDVPCADEVLKFLVRFANEEKPRAGVTFRAKVRALRVAFRLSQMSENPVIARYITATFGAGNEQGGMKELLSFTTHCSHMVSFEEHRVPIEVSYFLSCDKEAVARSLLRQFPDQESWVLRCASRLLLDFDVQRVDLWETVLAAMRRHRMFRSLASVLAQLSRRPLIRSLENAADTWEQVLKHPITALRRRLEERSITVRRNASDKKASTEASTTKASSDSDRTTSVVGVAVLEGRAVLNRMVLLLQKCPFLDCIDVSSFVVELGELTALVEEKEEGRAIIDALDLYGTAVRCAMVIPRPSTRFQALKSIVEAGAYMAVLNELTDVAFVLNRDHLLIESEDERTMEREEDDVAGFREQLGLIQAAFAQAVKRKGGDGMLDLLDSPFELGFVEFYAATSVVIDPVVAILLSEKRLTAAATCVELWYELHPAEARPVVVDNELETPSASTLLDTEDGERSSRSATLKSTLKAFVAASTSPELAPFRTTK